ncbi:ribonuclease H-like domain-containing protein [Tanacetum coccineum]
MPGDDDTTQASGVDGSSASETSKLIYGDEFYLHPNDSSITNFINIKLKGTKNYNVWSCAMTLALQTKKKIGFIDGKCKKPSDKSLANQWDLCNSPIRSSLLTREPLPDVKTAFSLVSREESHRGSSSSSRTKSQVSVFAAKGPNSNNYNRKNQNNKNPNLDLYLKKTMGTGSQQGEAESKDDDGESSSFESINTSDDESLRNDGITDDISHS